MASRRNQRGAGQLLEQVAGQLLEEGAGALVSFVTRGISRDVERLKGRARRGSSRASAAAAAAPPSVVSGEVVDLVERDGVWVPAGPRGRR